MSRSSSFLVQCTCTPHVGVFLLSFCSSFLGVSGLISNGREGPGPLLLVPYCLTGSLSASGSDWLGPGLAKSKLNLSHIITQGPPTPPRPPPPPPYPTSSSPSLKLLYLSCTVISQ